MNFLNGIDYAIIVIYFSILIGLGLYLQKKASSSLEDYFLAGRNLPWWALGISGMAAWLDVTGTMMVTSFLFLLGPRGLFIEFRGGAVLLAAVCMLWTGKWHRRSQCITGAQWMVFRFGEGFFGNFARVVSVMATITATVGMLAYMIKGVGLFLAMFLPYSPFTCALILIVIAAIYTMASGFYGVVFTDIFQSGIVILAVFTISFLAFKKVDSAESLALIAEQVTGNQKWIGSSPSWFTEMPKGYECYRHLFMFALFYLIRNIFGGMGVGAEPKYFGAKNDRDCGTQTMLTIFCIMFRWPLMLSFAILGIFLVRDIFPDQSVLLTCSEVIKNAIPGITQAQWPTTLSSIINNPQDYSVELINQISEILGQDWTSRLHLLSFEGTINPERILPSVVLMTIPLGLRGMVLVALIAASMSTFDTSVNIATGFFTKDLYQRYFRPKASTKELMAASYLFIIALVCVGFLFAYSIKSINDIWGWIIMGLGAGLLIPGVLRLYWWRFNAGGFAFGTLAGLIGAFIQRGLWPGLNEIWQFLILGAVGTIASIIGTYLTEPTNMDVVVNFYKKTRPFGFWGKLKDVLTADEQKALKKEHKNDILALPFVLCWQITLFLMPMQLIIHTYRAFFITLAISLIGLTGTYFIWYRNLPKTNYFE